MTVSADFFLQPTEDVAQALLGCVLVHQSKEGTTSGVIVETEAYLHDDPASHSFKGKTLRNAVMFNPPGHVYVYFTYGMHHCFNVVTNKQGIGEAVLIRALQPLEGIHIMKQRRKNTDLYRLCNGPAKLVQAMGITKQHNGISLLKGSLRLLPLKTKNTLTIVQTRRIGISQGKDLLLRSYIKENEFVSKT